MADDEPRPGVDQSSSSRSRLSRRGLVGAAGAVAAGSAAAASAGWAARGSADEPASAAVAPDRVGRRRVDFHGTHQAGIATHPPAFIELVALDLLRPNRSRLRELLRAWTRRAADLAAGREASSDASRELGAEPASLTVTFGFGPDLFTKVGLAGARPPGVAELPAFKHDALESRWTGGDLLVQVCADDPLVADHAVRQLLALVDRRARQRWRMPGFTRTAGMAKPSATRRNLMGHLDGSANPVPDSSQFARTVWAGADEPGWLRGGTTLVLRRIRMDLDAWSAAGRKTQERTIGRHKSDGSPLTGGSERSRPDFHAQGPHGGLVIPADAHVRLAAPEQNYGHRIFRRPYAFRGAPQEVGPHEDGTQEEGQLFCSFQADVRRGFLPIQQRLDVGDHLNAFTTAVGSAVFAIPPGCQPGGYVGETLLDA